MTAVAPSDSSAPGVMSEPLLHDAPSGLRLSGGPRGPAAITCLLPVSPCPQLAFDNRIQSVDLFATDPHILEASSRCGWCPCCSGATGPPFDWIAHLHRAASSPAAANRERNAPSSRSSGSGAFPTHSESQPRSQPPEASEQQQALQIVQNLRDGAIPVGAKTDLSTLVRHNQLVFGGVKEVNAAFSNAWLCIYACMVFAFFLAPLGWVLLFLVTISSTVRRTLDEYVLYWMSQACSRVNMLFYPCGVALMLLEGTSEDASISVTRNASIVDVEGAGPSPPRASPGRKVWVLRVFLLPGAPMGHRNSNEGDA